MRLLSLLCGAILLSTSSCSQQQAGCTAENCKLIVFACRVEFQGGPTQYAECSFNKPTEPVDNIRYCVDACNAHLGNGNFASCLAANAETCRDGGLAGISRAIDLCSDKTGKGSQKTCDDACLAAQATCDEKCSGGRPCDRCLRSGGSCGSVCVTYAGDGGFNQCLDCSAKCGLQYVQCSDSCPRAQ